MIDLETEAVADDKRAQQAAAAEIKKLGPSLKELSSDLDDLAESAAAYCNAIKTLHSGIDRLKEKPDKKAFLGTDRQIAKLMEASRLTAISERYERSREKVDDQSSHSSRRKMLANLVSFTSASYAQHTGDKAGEAYNRKGARAVHAALKDLKDNPASYDHAQRAMGGLKGGPSRGWQKVTVSDLKTYSADADADRKKVVEAKAIIDTLIDDFQSGAKQLLQAFEAGDSADVA